MGPATHVGGVLELEGLARVLGGQCRRYESEDHGITRETVCGASKLHLTNSQPASKTAPGQYSSQRLTGHLRCIKPAPWGKADATRWFDSDAGVLSEAKPVAPTRASSQRPGLWKPLAPHALRAGLRLHPVGGLSMERLIRSML